MSKARHTSAFCRNSLSGKPKRIGGGGPPDPDRAAISDSSGGKRLCPVADKPKLLDFRPMGVHGFRHHQLRIDQAARGHRVALRLRGKGRPSYTAWALRE